MRDSKTLVGALCIVVAMVLGAFAGLVYGGPGGVQTNAGGGTRGEDQRLTSARDVAGTPFAPDDLRAEEETPGPSALAGTEPVELTLPGGEAATASRATEADLRLIAENEAGTVTISRSPGTRGAERGPTLPSGLIDAGGPYGGPDTYEGGPALTFTVTSNDPSILFFRWDFNGDGVFDFPDQTGAGTLGLWTTQTTFDRVFLDNFYGGITVQGWDGVSTYVQINVGDNLGQPSSFQWTLGMFGALFRAVGWQFRAKQTVTVTELGHYHYVYPIYEMYLWSVSGVRLGMCTPVHVTFSWNWCTLPTPVTITLGQEYWISERLESTTTGYYTPPDTPIVQFEGTYGCFGYTTYDNCFKSFFWSATFIPSVDFRWQQTLTLPDTTADAAFLEVHNVAPTVWGVGTSPSPANEGSPANFVAQFSDPGLDDTWQYRWTFHDGTQSPWLDVSRFDGGAKVLILHSWTGDIGGIKSNIQTACGTFCLKVYDLDFGPLGQNRIPALAELTQYDVLVVGTNWGPIPNPTAVGDRLAEYMDAAGPRGGGIVMMNFGFYSSTLWGIAGRWESEKSPMPRAGTSFFSSSLGTIYAPGHPILDGVAAVSAYYRQAIFNVNSGAERIADWADGTVFAGVKTDAGGRIAVGLNYFPAITISGDWARVIANAIRFASRQPDPTLKVMPIALDAYAKVFADDDPTTTTPQDTFPVSVEVRDDDDRKIELTGVQEQFFNTFELPAECSYSTVSQLWPAGWTASPSNGWRCQFDATRGSRGPGIRYNYNDFQTSRLMTNTYDLSANSGARIEFRSQWSGTYTGGTADGYLEASTDGGATFPYQLLEYHQNNPGAFSGNVKVETSLVAYSPSVVFRFRYVSGFGLGYWLLDNVRISVLSGNVIDGAGDAVGTATVANVPPTVAGGFDSAQRNEAQGLLFSGFTIQDPALLAPTEWFAYAINLDDGSPSQWVYKGSLAPPKFRVLVIHTLCSSGNACSDYASLRDTLRKADDVASVDPYNFIQFPPSAPSLATMLQYDVIVVATNYAYISYPPFDLARRQIGDRLAQYIDAGRGGVLTFMAIYDLSSFYGDIFSINGRYMDEDYGAFERETYLFSPSTLGRIYDADHDLLTSVRSGQVNSLFIHPGDLRTTVGGLNNAAGRSGVLLADWSDGDSAIGVKQLANGMRTAHIGAFGHPDGADAGQLIRNAVGWVAGGIPSPKISAFTHAFGDNGVYTVDFMAVDDDMGFVWDPTANAPVQVLPGPSISHRYVSVSVDNTDPVITPNSIEAFIATEVCVRLTGQTGNSVTARVFADGALVSTTTTVRIGSDPNPATEKCGLFKLDVLRPHTYSVDLTYVAPNGGSNPTWLIFLPWRDPVSPGHGTVTYKYDFARPMTVTQALTTLKQDLLASGQGAKIDFGATASDAGTDDLAFVWIWDAVFASPYTVPTPEDAVTTIHVHHNSGGPRTDGVLADPQHLGFTEAYFDRAANTGRSPLGAMGVAYRDAAIHAFDMSATRYFVVLIVLDDDTVRGYPSAFEPNDGVDMQFVYLDLG